MANNLNSNVTRKVARVFLEAFEASRVLTKTVNTQLLSGKFNPSSGSNVDFKRPHDYNSIRTSGGDISSSTCVYRNCALARYDVDPEFGTAASPYSSLPILINTTSL